MKVRSAVKKMCKDCYLVKRKGKLFCYCKTDPRHKQRQGYHVSTIAHAYATSFPRSSSNPIGNTASNIFPSQVSFISPPITPFAPVNSQLFSPLRFGLGAASFFVRGV